MRTQSTLGAATALFLLLGCGGGGGARAGRGEVSGVVFDGDGKPVRGARVVADGRETFTDSAGAYVLRDIAAKDLLVRASATGDGGTRFVGQNLARVYKDERDLSVNVALVAETAQARVVGRVLDRNDNVMVGLRVAIRPTDGSILSSSSALTDRDGYFTIDGLMRGVPYRLVANDLGHGEDALDLTLDSRERNVGTLRLTVAENGDLDPPANLDAVAYTTPGDQTRSLGANAAYESVKRLLDPTRAARMAKRKAAGRDTVLGRPIEVDLFWDDYDVADTVGFGVYRRIGPSGSDTQFYLQDPQAAYFADGDSALQDGTGYSYAVTAIGSNYDPQRDQGESGFSNRVSVTPLADLTNARLDGDALRWDAVAGATTYRVYLYNRYPGLGVVPVNGSNGQATPTNSLSVSGLTAGRYYYVVVGERADGSARTLSLIGDFTVSPSG